MSAEKAPEVLIRVDGGGRFGFGHLTRSLALARALRDRHGATVRFATRDDAATRSMIAAVGFDTVILDPAPEAAAVAASSAPSEDRTLSNLVESLRPRVLIVDHPHVYDPATFEHVRSCSRLVVVQAEHEAAWLGDLLVFPAGHHTDEVLERCASRDRTTGTRCLAGMAYVMLADEARDAEVVPGPPYVVLAAGGSDPHALLERWCRWLSDADVGVPVMALTGAAAVDTGTLVARKSDRVTVRPFTHQRLFSAHLAVVAFGVTAYELVHRGVPTLTAGHSDRTTEVSERFASRYRCTRHIGDGRSLGSEAFVAHVRDALRPSVRESMLDRQRGLVDGQGTARVADAIATLAQGEG